MNKLLICNKASDPKCNSNRNNPCYHREPHPHNLDCTIWDVCPYSFRESILCRCINVNTETGENIIARVYGELPQKVIKRYYIKCFYDSGDMVNELLGTLEDVVQECEPHIWNIQFPSEKRIQIERIIFTYRDLLRKEYGYV